MSKLIITILITVIKFYKFFLSPFLGNRCRYYPSCSDYFIKSLKDLGLVDGLLIGIKRLFKCHPIKFLGGGSGIDLVPTKKKLKQKRIFNG